MNRGTMLKIEKTENDAGLHEKIDIESIYQ
jgi:hypothetical protein